MKAFTIAVNLFLCLALSACSNTKQVKLNTGDSNHYYAKEFSHTEFTTYNKDSIKKVASSDQQLMLSLLNRPIPEDQKMMLAFAKRQDSHVHDSILLGVQIKGDRKHEKNSARAVSQYAQLIEQDINAVSISTMPK